MSLDITSAKDIETTKGTYLIYGSPGSGKTSAVKHFPGNTLVLDIDRTTRVLKGCENVDILKVDNIKTWSDWSSLISKRLPETDLSKYDNIVVDNVSELERCILSDLGSAGKNNGVPSQGDYQYLQFKLVNSLRFMKQSLDKNIIWTAWETTDLFTTAEGQQFNRAYPTINHKVRDNICGLCDVVARVTINKDGERGFVLTSTNSIYAKNQIDDRKGCLHKDLILGSDNPVPVEAIPE